MFCKSCGKEILEEDNFCSACGAQIKEIKKTCPNCDSELEGDKSFCSNCGHSFVADSINEEKVSERKPAKVWDVFGQVGFVLGIVGIATSIILIGLETSIPGIVLSGLAMNNSIKYKDKAKTGLILSIIGTAVSVLVLIIFYSSYL